MMSHHVGARALVVSEFATRHMDGLDDTERCIGSLAADPKNPKNPRPEVTADLARDFCVKNLSPGTFWPDFAEWCPTKVVEPGDLAAIFRDGRGKGWARLRERFPGAEILVRVSRVGLDVPGDKALVYTEAHREQWGGGGGYFYFFEKKDGGWSQGQEVRTVWVE